MTTFAVERFADVLPEVEPLAMTHWRETGEAMHGRTDGIPLDVPVWQGMEVSGTLHVVTARREGLLVGYAAFCVGPNAVMPGRTQASCIALYLTENARCDPHEAMRLLRWAEESLRERGADCVSYVSQVARPCDAVYRRLGARMTETVWFKEL